MSGVMEAGMEKGGSARSGAPSGEPEASRGVRWSARRKEEVVLRLLRGESLDLLAGALLGAFAPDPQRIAHLDFLGPWRQALGPPARERADPP